MKIKLPESEAANIALHLINSQVNNSYKEDYLDRELDDEERLYLTVHIQRITSK